MDKEFKIDARGYRPQEVDQFLDMIIKDYVDTKAAKRYLAVAEKILRTLASEEYLAEVGEQCGFILRHSTGNKPGDSEVDVPLTYADYYFLEALMRWRALSE